MIQIKDSFQRSILCCANKHYEGVYPYIVAKLNLVAQNMTLFRKTKTAQSKKKKASLKSMPKMKEFVSYLLATNASNEYVNLKDLILCAPFDVESIHTKLMSFIPANMNKVHRDLIINAIFNYDTFSGAGFPNVGKSKYYSAYDLVESLNVQVCPYCNRQFITIAKKTRNRSATLDHFYLQKDYPVFALSFYNLIPCCSFCNSNLKGDFPFTASSHVHPYLEEYGNDSTFSYIPYTKILLRNNPHADSDKLIRIGRTSSAFSIEDLYMNHLDFANEIYDKRLEESDVYFDSLCKLADQIKAIHPKPEDFYRFYFGNYMKPCDFEKRPLSKLTFDLVKELGILEKINFKS